MVFPTPAFFLFCHFHHVSIFMVKCKLLRRNSYFYGKFIAVEFVRFFNELMY